MTYERSGRFVSFSALSFAEWWIRLGRGQRLMLAVRDHRRFRPLFTERNRRHPHAWYLHLGPYCLHARWEDA